MRRPVSRRDAISSPVIDALEVQKETGDEEEEAGAKCSVSSDVHAAEEDDERHVGPELYAE
jgi:hypothetical protein